MGYEIRIRKKASSQIEAASEWFLQKNKGLEIKFLQDLSVCIDDISENPVKYQMRYKGVRVKFLKKFDFGIHYIFDENIIHILAVFHTSQSPENW
ncbi:type II toxin-antitoxin system RelE/ParE family toxin [uncultured Flavobacterium sp.]|uniref:type II toxin-antitoxin system RelE/ParE family toxin n=1 Tax=uncultured Flavobacterium sp. TaxID=165435 RepID=UPI0025CFDBBB|nr:type II toxin-antitoxin system RelE/ParE family toxin [uncultured Flavobacterium sp.]